MKEAEAVNSIPRKFLKFAPNFLHSSARWFKCIYRELRRFSVCYEMFFGVVAVVTYKIYFSQHYDFPYNVSKSVANTNLKQHVLLMD